MAMYIECTLRDFHDFIGPKIRNDVATITKAKKKELDLICEKCSNKVNELDAAHKHGRSRKDLIKIVLDDYESEDGKYIIPDLQKVLSQIHEEHLPLEDNFRFLCKPCHTKYDAMEKRQNINTQTNEVDLYRLQDKPTKSMKTSLTEGDVFTEQDLYDKFQVRNTGGIRPSNKNKVIILIDSFATTNLGQGNYQNRIDEENGIVEHTGEGEDNQEMVRNNKKILESKSGGFKLLYFEKPYRNHLVFRFEVEYDSHYVTNELNSEGKLRKVIKFKLKIL